MSGLPQHLLLPSFLLLLPFFLVLILTPTGEGIKCLECVWHEGNDTLKLGFKKSRYCSRDLYNACKAPANTYEDGYLCVSIIPEKDTFDGYVFVGLAPADVGIPRKCKKNTWAKVKDERIYGTVCACKDRDFCLEKPSAASAPSLALSAIVASALLSKMI
ncbi:uncharacterized protein LOC143031494 [Oratosquilla oratoria]|uniref:uncharacterized protein LOC143031494 n=1 Tax=Oratosquilla oratoria TaxID=337810 RepID=UPI003F77023A